MTTKSYKIAKWFVVANYITIVGSLFFAAFLGLEAIVMWETALPAAVFVGIVAIGFAIGIFYSISILPRMRETIHVTDQQISYEYSNGNITAISWGEDFVVKNRLFLGRVDLSSKDGQRVIKLEQQLAGYQELLEFITAKLDEKQSLDAIK